MAVQFYGGVVLFDGSQVAMDAACCCEVCICECEDEFTIYVSITTDGCENLVERELTGTGADGASNNGDGWFVSISCDCDTNEWVISASTVAGPCVYEFRAAATDCFPPTSGWTNVSGDTETCGCPESDATILVEE